MAFFSIIIPTYNNAAEIHRAIYSIQGQVFEDWNLIIVDDGSTDNTRKVIAEFLLDERIKYYKQVNKGVASARNFGLSKAMGEFVSFLDSDDEVTPEWLNDFYNLYKVAPDAGYLSCGYHLNKTPKFPKMDLNISPNRYSSLAGSFAIKREILEEIGGYDLHLKQSENWEMTARALEYCRLNSYSIEHTNNLNFTYTNYPTADETRLRDEYRGSATYHLFNKYKNGGVLYFRKDNFLLSSAVNYARAGKLKKSRKIFYENFRNKPTLANLAKIFIFEIPSLRRRKWMRKKNSDKRDG